MPKPLTKEQYKQRLFDAVGDKYSLKDDKFPYKNKHSQLTFHCNIHNQDFSASAECFMRGPNDVRSSCPVCYEEKFKIKRIENTTIVTCAYCGKQFEKLISRLKGSKSGLYFCCREHKDLAQRVDSGKQFDSMRPQHYNITGISNYRRRALDYYPQKCAVCDWDEDIDILQVHHIDENRQNNNIENLIVLCPTCHYKITSHKYKLIDREHIVLC